VRTALGYDPEVLPGSGIILELNVHRGADVLQEALILDLVMTRCVVAVQSLCLRLIVALNGLHDLGNIR
jgi:hypothetical protein